MKIYCQITLCIFLVLLIGSTLQFKIETIKQDEKVPNDYPANNESQKQDTPKNSNNDQTPNIDDKRDEPRKEGSAQLYDDATQWQSSGSGKINYLTKHFINCKEDNSALNYVTLEKNEIERQINLRITKVNTKNVNVRFRYTCVKSNSISTNCRNYSTEKDIVARDAEKALAFLDRHYIDCPNDEVLKSFGLKSKGIFFGGIISRFQSKKNIPRIWYDYTCCKADSNREIFFESTSTGNPNGRFENLENQTIDAKDFNAINSIHMQAPKGVIFYQAKVNTLKGETSNSYPDPCEYKNSNSNTNGAADPSKNAQNDGEISRAFVGKI
jgi:hypothetical protein